MPSRLVEKHYIDDILIHGTAGTDPFGTWHRKKPDVHKNNRVVFLSSMFCAIRDRRPRGESLFLD